MSKEITQFEVLLNAKPFSNENAEIAVDGRININSLQVNDIGYVYHYPRVQKCVILDISPVEIIVWLIGDDECDSDNFETIEVDSDQFVTFFKTKEDCEEYVNVNYIND